MELTKGEKMVRASFNPSKDDVVDQYKKQTAELIDMLETLRETGKDQRLISLAQTAYEEAAMWAVKAATS